MLVTWLLPFIVLLTLVTGCLPAPQTTPSRRFNVLLSVEAAHCSPEEITVYMANDGTEASHTVTVTAFRPDGSKENECSIASIEAGARKNCSIARSSGSPPGIYAITATTSGSSVKSSVYCPF